jgi:hypothetical protein
VDGFVRIKVMALEKNRRDIYVKFDAEVRILLPGRGAGDADCVIWVR